MPSKKRATRSATKATYTTKKTSTKMPIQKETNPKNNKSKTLENEAKDDVESKPVAESNKSLTQSTNNEVIETIKHGTSKKRKEVEEENTSEQINGVLKKQKINNDIPPNITLYFQNLNDKISTKLLKQELYLLLSSYSDIIDIFTSVKLRGQAHVVLANINDGKSIIKELQGLKFLGKELVINYSVNQTKNLLD